MLSRAKRSRYALEWLGTVLVATLVPIIPRRACLLVAWAGGRLAALFDRAGRKVAAENLQVAFGDSLGSGPRSAIITKSYQHFSQTALDLLWSRNLTRHNFGRFVELENFEETSRDTGPERSVIIACYHYSNFEWLSLVCGFLGLAGTIIAQEFKNSRLDPIFRQLREQSGHQFVARDRGIVRLYKVLRRKGRTALLVDLTIPPRQGAVAIDCFGLKTSVTSAHAWLHQQTGAPIIPAHCEPLPNGRYRLVFHSRLRDTAAMSLQQIAQACWNSFEPYVRRNPAPWLWMYKHWRYKPSQTDREYPSYAQTWPAFDRMIARSKPPAHGPPFDNDGG
jgi:lauroyl/myristoyl acyltransferase